MIVQEQMVLENINIAKDTYLITLACENTLQMKPGMFVNVQVDGYSLRRPLSISSINDHSYTLIYKIFGDGTRILSSVKPGETLNIMGPLGSPFPIHEELEDVLIIGGGVGVPPLYEVAKRYRQLAKKVTVVLGFNDSPSIFLKEAFENLGCTVYIATMDGSTGIKGTVLHAIKAYQCSGFVYACGPAVMLQAIENRFEDGYISKEARMACGIGVCMSCVCKNRANTESYQRICKEGPVFKVGEVY